MSIMGWLTAGLAACVAGIYATHLHAKVEYRRVKGEELDRINAALSSTRRSRIPTSRQVNPGREIPVAIKVLEVRLMKDTPLPDVVKALEYEEGANADSVSLVFFPHRWGRFNAVRDPSNSTWVYFNKAYIEQW